MVYDAAVGGATHRVCGACVVWIAAMAAMPAAHVHAEGSASTAEQRQACIPRDGLHFICGPEASEDIVQIPGTAWLIASGLNVGRPAHLFLIDALSRQASIAFPTDVPALGAHHSTSGCSGPPDPARMSMDGLGLRAESSGVHTLYAANHGDRLAVEIFGVDTRGAYPRIRWRDCVPLPPGVLPNAVAPMPGNGFLVTSFYDPRDRTSWERMARGEVTGRILHWEAGTGFRTLPGSEMSGANGLAISRDGGTVYASAWSAREIVVLPLGRGRRREIPLSFMPDNIHPLDDGSLLVGGQRTAVERIARCGGAACPQPWTIVRVDPGNGAVEPLITRSGTPEVNYGCGGIEVDGVLYFTARGIRAVGYLPLNELPSLH